MSKNQIRLRWRRETARGGTTMYAGYIAGVYMVGIEKMDGRWWATIPECGQFAIENFRTLRDAKKFFETDGRK